MTLSDLASLGSFVSGVAVLVSLAFLYYQLRQIGAQMKQAEKNQRAMMTQGAVGRSVAQTNWIGEHAALFVKVGAAPETLTDAETLQIIAYVRTLVLNFQDYHHQHEGGLIDAMGYNMAVGAVRYWLSIPALRAVYLDRAVFAPDVRQLIDRVIKGAPLLKHESESANLRIALAKVRDAAPGLTPPPAEVQK
jgi:hypothetical protein